VIQVNEDDGTKAQNVTIPNAESSDYATDSA